MSNDTLSLMSAIIYGSLYRDENSLYKNEPYNVKHRIKEAVKTAISIQKVLDTLNPVSEVGTGMEESKQKEVPRG